MIPVLVVLACSCRMLLDALEITIHRVRMEHVDSQKQYMADLFKKLFGTEQGSGGSPHFWLYISKVILTCIDMELFGFTCSNPNRLVICSRNEDTFVDDSGLAINGDNGDVFENLCTHSQTHEKFLHVTGGKLALHKCF